MGKPWSPEAMIVNEGAHSFILQSVLLRENEAVAMQLPVRELEMGRCADVTD